MNVKLNSLVKDSVGIDICPGYIYKIYSGAATL